MRDGILQARARSLRDNATDAERCLWRHLRRRALAGFRFRRQVPIAGYIVDFACLEARLVIEVDGGQHQEQRHCDVERDRRIAARGYKVLRFWDNEVLGETESVLGQVHRALTECRNQAPPSQPPPASRGEG